MAILKIFHHIFSSLSKKDSDLFCYIINLWNKLGHKNEFGLPTQVTMESLGIGSYNTYKKTLDELISFGVIKLIKESKNQHQSKVIAISIFDKASDEATDKDLPSSKVQYVQHSLIEPSGNGSH